MTPVERLNLSRQYLRAAMAPPPIKPPTHLFGERIGALTANLIERAKAVPAIAELIEPVQAWWAHHPWRTAGIVAADASRKLTAPLAEQHPLALMLGAFVVGAALAFSRPWRWISRPALFAGLIPSLASRTIRELPFDSFVKLLSSLSAPRAEGP